MVLEIGGRRTFLTKRIDNKRKREYSVNEKP